MSASHRGGSVVGVVLLLPPRMSSDDRLARLAAGGRDDAFGALYERHRPALFAYSRAILRDDDDARDAVQNAALKALTALGRSDAPAVPRAWLFRIVHNEAISIIRRRRPHDELGDADGVAIGGPLDDVLAREPLAELVTELHALPDRQRRALLLRELAGLGYDEIAEAAGMTAGAARQAVHEARRALAEQQEGRDAACDDIRDALVDGDGRTRQRRAVRAHLRGCDGCRTFDKRLRRRTRDLRSLIPAGAGAFFAQALVIGGGGGAVPAGLAKGVACVLAVGSGAAVVEVAQERGSPGVAGRSVAEATAAVREDAPPARRSPADAPATPAAPAPFERASVTKPAKVARTETKRPARREEPVARDEEPSTEEEHAWDDHDDDDGDWEPHTFGEPRHDDAFTAPATRRDGGRRHHRSREPDPQPAPTPTQEEPAPEPPPPATPAPAAAKPPAEEPPADADAPAGAEPPPETAPAGAPAAEPAAAA